MTRESVCVFGSRDFPDLDLVHDAIIRLPMSTILVVGGARGVDRKAEEVGRARGMRVDRYDADWDKGRLAAFERNRLMVARSDRGIGFWDGMSSGTFDTLTRFAKAGKRIDAVVWPQTYEEFFDLAGHEIKLAPKPWSDPRVKG